jgi:hypothetical protein
MKYNTRSSFIPSILVTGILVITIIISAMLFTSQQLILAQQGNISDNDRNSSRLFNVEINVPLMKAFVNGNILFFIITDASDNDTAALIANKTGFKVNFAPILRQVPESSVGQIYTFTNGIAGDGVYGFQLPVADIQTGDGIYSPLLEWFLVKWNEGVTPRELKSVHSIQTAQINGELTISRENITINSPIIQCQFNNCKMS